MALTPTRQTVNLLRLKATTDRDNAIRSYGDHETGNPERCGTCQWYITRMLRGIEAYVKAHEAWRKIEGG